MIALAFAALVAVAGTAGAQGGLIDASESGVGINLPGGEDLPPLDELPQCANLRDDDDDGRTDLADADCAGPLDNSEAAAAPPPVPEPEPEPEPEIPPGPGTGPGTRRPRQRRQRQRGQRQHRRQRRQRRSGLRRRR